MNRYFLLAVTLSVLWLPGNAQPRRLFEFEQREGDPRPKPDLQPNIVGTQRAVSDGRVRSTSPRPSPKSLEEEDRVGSKAPGLSAAAKGAKAGWQPNGIAVCDTAAAALPRIVSDGKYGAIICWTESYRGWPDDTVNTVHNIYAQRVDSSGYFLWPSQGVPVCSLSTSYASYPEMVADGYGGAIIAWEDTRGGLGYTRVFAQRIDSLGNRVWPENGVLVCNQMSGYVELCSDGHGGAIIAYVDGRDAATSDNIYAQRIDSTGDPVWSIDGVPVCTADSIQFWPATTSGEKGGAIIAWQDYCSGNYNIYAQMVDAMGNLKWVVNGVEIFTNDTVNERYPKLTQNNKGGAIIRGGNDVDYITRVQSVDSTGNKLWDSLGINTLGTYGVIKPILFGGGVSNSYAAQRIDSIGNIRWGSGILLHGDTTGGQFGATSDSYGNLFVIWDELRNDLYYSDQYIQKVDTNGNLMWGATGTPICTLQMGDETYPKITTDDLGGAICTWFGDPDHIVFNNVYVQRVNANGIPGGVTEIYNDINKPLSINVNIYPNPAKEFVKINYNLPRETKIKISIYNTLGQKVKSLVNESQMPGYYSIKWDSKNDTGKKAAAGVYFYRLEAGEYRTTKKMVLIK